MSSKAWNSSSLRGASRVAASSSSSASAFGKGPAVSRMSESDKSSSRRLEEPGRAECWVCCSSWRDVSSLEVGCCGQKCVSGGAGGKMAHWAGCPLGQTGLLRTASCCLERVMRDHEKEVRAMEWGGRGEGDGKKKYRPVYSAHTTPPTPMRSPRSQEMIPARKRAHAGGHVGWRGGGCGHHRLQCRPQGHQQPGVAGRMGLGVGV